MKLVQGSTASKGGAGLCPLSDSSQKSNRAPAPNRHKSGGAFFSPQASYFLGTYQTFALD